VEIDEDLATRAASRLKTLGCTNVQVVHGDASAGWPECAPYQAIVMGAAATELPSALVDQLDLGGRLVIALGDSDAQILACLRRHVDSLASTTIGGCHLDMLHGRRRSPSSFPWVAPKKESG